MVKNEILVLYNLGKIRTAILGINKTLQTDKWTFFNQDHCRCFKVSIDYSKCLNGVNGHLGVSSDVTTQLNGVE